jgi:energy-converting hydrogenase Eha subunit C
VIVIVGARYLMTSVVASAETIRICSIIMLIAKLTAVRQVARAF